MQHYQDNLGAWHVLEDVSFEHLLSKNNPNLTFTPRTQAQFDAAHVTAIPTQSEQFKAIERAIEKYMDSIAQADGWDNRWTCVARAGYANPWQAKAIKFGQWMDACWQYTIQEQAKITAGTRTMPTPTQAIAELPSMVW